MGINVNFNRHKKRDGTRKNLGTLSVLELAESTDFTNNNWIEATTGHAFCGDLT
jgi:hypothetical protein